jgi:hypothetical protein
MVIAIWFGVCMFCMCFNSTLGMFFMSDNTRMVGSLACVASRASLGLELHEIRQTVSGELSARGADRVLLRQGTRAAPPRCQAPAQFDGVHRKGMRLGGDQGGAALQEKDIGIVAEARPQGTASSPWHLFEWRQ